VVDDYTNQRYHESLNTVIGARSDDGTGRSKMLDIDLQS
jgi:hypothetical protein